MFNVLLNERPVKAYIAYWNNALNFSHNYATRHDFWYVFIINFILMICLSLDPRAAVWYTYLTIIPTFALISRRYHDIGLSGWWQIIMPMDLIAVLWPSRKYAAYHRDHHQRV